VWPRCDAECSPERGYYYHPSRHSAGQPIVAGWAYQFIAQLNFIRESWTALVDVERLRPRRDANEVAAEQVKAFVRRSSEEGGAAPPLFVFDAGYDPVKLQQGLEGSSCQILVRLRAGRCFRADPSLAGPPAPIGRPRRHGPKMKCNDPNTWPEPSTEYICEDAGYGTVRVRAFSKLHPKVRAHQGRGSRGPLPIVVGTLILVEVERDCLAARGVASRACCGCGGMAPKGSNQSWACCGALTSGVSTWSTPSAFSSRLWDGLRRACATPSRRTGGRGWFWPLSPS
jgi:hypothetical protein